MGGRYRIKVSRLSGGYCPVSDCYLMYRVVQQVSGRDVSGNVGSGR